MLVPHMYPLICEFCTGIDLTFGFSIDIDLLERKKGRQRRIRNTKPDAMCTKRHDVKVWYCVYKKGVTS